MKNITTTLVFLFATVTLSFAQNKEATTTDGRKVILKPDGTWVYAATTTKETPTPTPSNDCSYRTNEIDDFTGDKKVILNEQDFINYTSDEIKRYYRKQDFVRCQVYAARINETKAAYFFWTLQTKEAYKLFGSIAQDSKIMVKFRDGETIELNFLKFDVGDTKYDLGHTTYSSYVILDEESVKVLKSKPIEKVRMYWSKGYQDYPVSNAYLFNNQLSCIE